ncbi:MAG: hypothetical protein HC880_05220 [Bacteroidia bacterium]|nr:hypothetical protein [Bacteroidia bacterium]
MRLLTIFYQIILLTIALGLSSTLNAQETRSTTKSIKDIYEYVKYKINRNSYYLNEFKINVGGLLWTNEKLYQNSQQYYYSFVGDDTPVLRMVIVNTKIAQVNYYEEYLYHNDGSLIFCYKKQKDSETENARELKAYYEDNLCINLILNDEIIDAKDATYNDELDEIKDFGVFFAQRFIKDMKEIRDEY